MADKVPLMGANDLFPMTAAIPLCKRFFGFVPGEDDLLDTTIEVIDACGNIGAADQVSWGLVVEDHHVDLCHVPSGAVREVSLHQGVLLAGSPAPSAVISYGHEAADNPYLSEDTLVGSPASQAIEMEALMEVYRADLETALPKGAFTAWRAADDHCLYLPSLKAGKVDVVFRGYRTDSDGLPLVSKEVLKAVAFQLNFNRVQIRYYMGQVPENMLARAEDGKERAIGQAKRAGGITDQGMSRILDVMVSHGRHRYGRSFRAGR